MLWFLAHYLDSDAQWTNKDGEPWSMERLVQVEVGKTVTAGACGGCHGLFALAYSRNGFLASGRTLYGPWFEADQKVKRHIEIARMYQNPDGTFSSNSFQGPGHSDDFEKRLGTTGHILEFLDVSLPQARLSDEWVRHAVTALSGELIEKRLAPCECGALYHAIDGLTIYRTRVWPELDPARRRHMAAKPVVTAIPTGPAPLANAAGDSLADECPGRKDVARTGRRRPGAVESPFQAKLLRTANVRMRSIRLAGTPVILVTFALVGCSEGPPTKAELDAIAALEHLSGQIKKDPDGHAVSLILTGVEARDTDIAPVAELHDLKFLSLERTSIGDAGVAHLAKLSDLQSLSLAGTKVTDAGLAHLAGLSSLENLDLKGLAITDRGLGELVPIKSLKHVYVSNTGPTSTGIDSLEQAIPHLHVTRQ